MSVIRGPNRDSIPRSFTALTRGMTDGDDHKGGLVSIITFNQSKCALREETLAGLVLGSTRSVLTWFADGEVLPIGKNRAGRSPRDLRGRASLLSSEQASQTKEISPQLARATASLTLTVIRGQNKQPCTPPGVSPTVNRCSRSREGIVDGEK